MGLVDSAVFRHMNAEASINKMNTFTVENTMHEYTAMDICMREKIDNTVCSEMVTRNIASLPFRTK